ncbi:MAG: hypothetical protein AB1586_33165 [Pseudomonadota bacterium]
MTSEPKRRVVFERLDRARAELQVRELLRLYDVEIQDPANADILPDLLVEKAIMLWRPGSEDEALALLQQCAASYDAASPNYHAGEYLVELGRFADALSHLSKCLFIEESCGHQWYTSAALLLRAYCAAKLGDAAMAAADIAEVDDEEDVLEWVHVDPVVSKSSVRRMIEQS